MTWTEERVAELIRLWQAGHSASAIGKMLGVSKNAVVGKAHRMQLPSRPSPIKQSTMPRRISKPAQPVTKTVITRPAAPPPRRIVRHAKGRSCMWPIGDPGEPDFHFCGAPALESKPYCEEHCARAYITRSRSSGDEAA